MKTIAAMKGHEDAARPWLTKQNFGTGNILNPWAVADKRYEKDQGFRTREGSTISWSVFAVLLRGF